MESQWTYPPIPGKGGFIGPVASWVDSGDFWAFDPDTYDPNNTFTYPITNQYRSLAGRYYEHWWYGKLGNGSQIAVGNYVWVIN